MSDKPATDRNIAYTVGKLSVTAVAMFAFVFVVMVPLYDVLCDALGINGKTSGERYRVVEAKVDESREIRIQFVATNNAEMSWVFRPSQTQVRVNPGATNDTVFYAKNPSANDMVAQAIPSVSPARAAEYFHKTECFCFNQQPLGAGEEANMPLQYIIDQDLPADIKVITLSYTIFDVTAMAANQASVARR
ncbi:MAG: cytochrome c oxidase assembly protein subunit 11 [Oceanicoccus sp.]